MSQKVTANKGIHLMRRASPKFIWKTDPCSMATGVDASVLEATSALWALHGVYNLYLCEVFVHL